MRERRGLVGHRRLVRHHFLCEGADPVLPHPGVYRVAHLEAGDIAPHLGHDARAVVAQHQRKTVREEGFQLALADSPVQRIHAGRVDLDANISRAESLCWKFTPLQHLRPTVLADRKRLHHDCPPE